MSDCSGIKTYIRLDDYDVSKYIDLTEKTDDERAEEFVRTIELAVESFKNQKYSVQIFTDIVHAAHNKVSDIFGEIDYNEDAPLFAVLNEEEIYLNFYITVVSNLEKFKEGIICVDVLYNQIGNEYETLKVALELEIKQKTKTNIK